MSGVCREILESPAHFFDPMTETHVLSSSSLPLDIVGKVGPDGKFGYSRRRKVHTLGSEAFARRVDRAKRELDGFHPEEMPKALAWWLYQRERTRPLGLSNVAKSHRLSSHRSPRGSRGITRQGRRIVYQAVDFLQWRYGKDCLSFATLTLPSFPCERNSEVCESWSEMVRQITQWLKRRLDREDLPNWIAGASEIQEKRQANTGEIALHLHFVFVGRSPKGSWAVSPRSLRKAWASIVRKQLPMLRDSNFSACENIQRVRKSASGYLSKYLSKGVSGMGSLGGSSLAFYPSAWYTVSNTLKWALRNCIRSTGEAISKAINTSRENCFYHGSVKTVASDGSSIIVGGYGCLKPGWSKLIPLPFAPAIPLAFKPKGWENSSKRHHDGFGFMF